MLGLAQNEQKYDEDAEELKMIFQKNKELLERLEYQFCFMEERGQDKKSLPPHQQMARQERQRQQIA